MDISVEKAVVFTGAGTTLAVARRFTEACALPSLVTDITPLSAGVPTFCAHDLAVFAIPSYGGRVPAPAAEKLARMPLVDGVPAVLLVTYGNRAVDDTFAELADIVSARGFVPVGGAAVVAHHSLMVDVAKGRPDAEDLAVVDALAADVCARLAEVPSAADAALTEIPGNRPYRAFGGVAFHAAADPQTCTRCGVCASVCPTGAIDPADPASTDSDRCVTCLRCVSACPEGVRFVDGGEALVAARAAFAERCAPRQPSYRI